MPPFVYLVPFLALFGTSRFTAIAAAVVYAVPVTTKIVADGIRAVPVATVEAANSVGSSNWQVISKVQLPVARRAITLAVNQGLIYVLAMVVVGGLVGAGALGYDVAAGFAQSELYGKGLAAGLAIVLLGVMLDRVTQAAARRTESPRLTVKSMGRQAVKKLRYAGVLTAVALALSGCGGAKVGEDKPAVAAGKDCGTFNLTVSPWVGYEANAAVVAYVATKDLGCKVVKKDLKEEIAWQGFSTGEVDVNLENWGHEDLKKKYITDQKVAVEAGSTGIKGVIGWYVPPWMAQQYPDITDWNNLNKYAALFKTSESGGKGQLLDGDPSYVTNDEALVKNLALNYKVVQSGSETALIQAFRDAREEQEAAARVLLRAAVVLQRGQAGQGQPARVQDRLRRRPGQGRLRLPAVRPGQDRLEEVRRLRQPGVQPGQELPVDQRGPERGRPDDRGRRDEPRRGREEVHRCAPTARRQVARGHRGRKRRVVQLKTRASGSKLAG